MRARPRGLVRPECFRVRASGRVDDNDDASSTHACRAKRCLRSFSLSPHRVLVFQIKMPRLRDGESRAQCHTAAKRRGRDPRFPDSKPLRDPASSVSRIYSHETRGGVFPPLPILRKGEISE